jgi:lipoyl-dependent peroxiredoxin
MDMLKPMTRISRLISPALTAANPEQLFASAYAACFGSALEAAAEKHGMKAENVSVTAQVSLQQDDSGGFDLSAALEGSIPGVDAATMQQLMQEANGLCPYSKAIRGNVEIDLGTSPEDFISG